MKTPGPRAKGEPLREAIKLLDRAVQWADGGGKVSAEELRAVRAALIRATKPAVRDPHANGCPDSPGICECFRGMR